MKDILSPQFEITNVFYDLYGISNVLQNLQLFICNAMLNCIEKLYGVQVHFNCNVNPQILIYIATV